MSFTQRMLCTSLGLLLTGPLLAQESKDKPNPTEKFPLVKQEQGKVEPGVDDVKKLATALADLKARVDQMDSSFVSRAECAKMAEAVKSLFIRVDRMEEMLAAKNPASPVTQASTATPAAPRPLADDASLKDGPANQDVLNRKLDELGRVRQQVEANSNAIIDLRRRYDALQDDVIRAQNKADRLEQEFFRSRGDARLTPSANDTQNRSSLILPLAPDSTAGSAPVAPIRPAGLGTIRLINSYVMPVTVVVDGRLHTLASNQTLNLDHAPGYFNYEVIGIQGNTLRTLSTGETMTIQIVPR